MCKLSYSFNLHVNQGLALFLHTTPRSSVHFLPTRPVDIELFSPLLPTDAGLPPIRPLDQRIRLTKQFAAPLQGRRDPLTSRT